MPLKDGKLLLGPISQSYTYPYEVRKEGSTVPIVRRPLKSHSKPPTPKAWEPSEMGQRDPGLTKASKNPMDQPLKPEMVYVTNKCRVWVVFKLQTQLYENNHLT